MYSIFGFVRRFIFHVKIDEGKGELGESLAERTLGVDPLNLIQVILAEGKKSE
jgi:hypothetical protein